MDPDGACLYIHSPKWEEFKKLFIETLVEVYQKYYNKQTIIYISLQDIRDEVCRLLRINPHTFELFLQKTYELSILHKIRYSISLETDLRLDMKIQILGITNDQGFPGYYLYKRSYQMQLNVDTIP